MRILLSHGDGGQHTNDLLHDVIHNIFQDELLREERDAALLRAESEHLAFSTDTFVINPIEFPGGDIGKLAVCGTVNDLAVSGAIPVYLSVAFIIEEGFPLKKLKHITQSLADTAREAGVRVVTGDTKVVEKGKGDQLYINTTGIGFVNPAYSLSYEHIKPGDRIVINGGIAEHAASVIGARMEVPLSTTIQSDCAPLQTVIKEALHEYRTIRFMRDPTRGGVATAMKEIAEKAHVQITLQEEAIPIRPEVRGTLELMGLEPYYMANEGKVLFIVSEEEAEELVHFLNKKQGHHMAAVIGEVHEGRGELYLNTAIGGTRKLGLLSGEPLPRIC